MINGVPQMWFVRFFPKKYYFFPFFLTLCSVATIKNLSAAEISEKYNLTQKDRTILSAAYRENSINHLKKYYALSKKLSDPLAQKIILHSYLVKQGTTGSFKQLSSFIKENPHWPRMKSLKKRIEEVMSNDLSPQTVLSWFNNNLIKHRWLDTIYTGTIRSRRRE